MADTFAVWQTNCMFNVEQIVFVLFFLACEIDGCVSEGFVTCVAGVTSSRGLTLFLFCNTLALLDLIGGPFARLWYLLSDLLIGHMMEHLPRVNL